MMELLRRYKKVLIVIFMSMLMVVFLAEGAISYFLSPNTEGVKWADSSLGEITFGDREAANTRTTLLERMGHNWQHVGRAQQPIELPHWILLSREAERQGLRADRSRTEAEAKQAGIYVEIQKLARQIGVAERQLFEALAEYASIEKMGQLVMATVATPSEAEVQAAARDALETVEIHAVRLPASAFVDAEAEVSEADLEAHFQKHRMSVPGPGVEFGYVLPPRVKIEYVKFDRGQIASSLRVADSKLEKEARAFYDQNKDKDERLMRPAEEIEAEVNSAEDPEEPVMAAMSWEAGGREAALQAVREQYAAEAAERLANWFISYVSQPWYVLEPGTDGYRTAPDAVKGEDYYRQALAAAPKSMAYDNAVSVTTSDYFSAQTSSSVAGIGFATAPAGTGSRRQTLASIATRVQGLATIPRVPGSGLTSDDFLSLHQTGPVKLEDGSGNLYVFRVVDTKPAGPADSLTQVREQVLADVRLQRGYDRALAAGQRLVTAANSSDLRTAFGADEEIQQLISAGKTDIAFVAPEAFSRVMPQLAAFGRFGSTSIEGIGSVPNAVADECFALSSANPPRKALEVRDASFVLSVEWHKTNPPPLQRFQEMRNMLASQMTNMRASVAASEWMDATRIEDRYQFKFAGDGS